MNGNFLTDGKWSTMAADLILALDEVERFVAVTDMLEAAQTSLKEDDWATYQEQQCDIQHALADLQCYIELYPGEIWLSTLEVMKALYALDCLSCDNPYWYAWHPLVAQRLERW